MFNPDSAWETIPLTGTPPPSPSPSSNSHNPPPYVGYAPYTYPAISDLESNPEKFHIDNNNNHDFIPTFGEHTYCTFPPPPLTATNTANEANAANETAHPCYFETLDFSDYLAAPIDNTTSNRNNTIRRGRQAMREGIAVVCVVLLVAVGLVVAGWAVAGGVKGLGVANEVGGKMVAGGGGKVVSGAGGGDGSWGPCTVARPRFCYIVVGGDGGGRT